MSTKSKALKRQRANLIKTRIAQSNKALLEDTAYKRKVFMAVKWDILRNIRIYEEERMERTLVERRKKKYWVTYMLAYKCFQVVYGRFNAILLAIKA